MACSLLQLPEIADQANAGKGCLCFTNGLGTPRRAQAVGVPFFGQAPALEQAQGASARAIPLSAPAIYMLFRPEQEHGLSGKDNIVVPMARGDGNVNESFGAGEFSTCHVHNHFQIAATAGGIDAGIFVQHSGNAEGIPDAVCPPAVFANLHRKSCGHGRKWSSAPKLSVFLEDESMRLAQLLEACSDLGHGAGKRSGHLADFGCGSGADDVTVYELAQACVEGHAFNHNERSTESASQYLYKGHVALIVGRKWADVCCSARSLLLHL